MGHTLLHHRRRDELPVGLAGRRPRLTVDLGAVTPQIRRERRGESAPPARLRGRTVHQRVPRDGARRVEQSTALRAFVLGRAVDRPVPRQAVRTWNIKWDGGNI